MHIDNIVITGSDITDISSLKSFLHTKFHMKDLRPLKYFFGVEVSRCKTGIFRPQRKHVLDLLAKTGNLSVKPCSTPMSLDLQLTKDNSELFKGPKRYSKLVGK